MFSIDTCKLSCKLESRGFITHFASNAAEARKIGLLLVGGDSTGFGSSITTGELGIYDMLRRRVTRSIPIPMPPPRKRITSV